MNIQMLKRIDEAPASGQILLYSRKSPVMFRSYTSLEEIKKMIQDMEDVLEIHLFNSEKEYRSLKSQSPRFSDGWIEHVADHSDQEGLNVFIDYTVLENSEYRGLKVLNKINYSETGMAYIDDYRLVMEVK